MCKCKVCGPVSHNEAEYSVSVGSQDLVLEVCRCCAEDLKAFGVRINQVVLLRRPAFRDAAFWFLGPVRSLFEEVKA